MEEKQHKDNEYNKICLGCINECKWLLIEGRIMVCPRYVPKDEVEQLATQPAKKKKKK